MEPESLTTPRLLLRTVDLRDAPAAYAACQDPAIQRWTAVPAPYLPEHAESFFGREVPAGWREDTMFTFGAFLRDERNAGNPRDSGNPGTAGTPGTAGNPGTTGTAEIAEIAENPEGPASAADAADAEPLEGPGKAGVAERTGTGTDTARAVGASGAVGAARAVSASGAVGAPNVQNTGAAQAADGGPDAPHGGPDATHRDRPAGVGSRVNGDSGVPTAFGTDAASDGGAPPRGGALVALLGITRRVMGTGELGFWAVREHRGRGYVTEATTAVARWAFTRAGIERLEWRAEVGNAGSRAVAEKSGFTIEGVLRSATAHQGVRRDCWVGSLLPHDMGLDSAQTYLPAPRR